jgi:Uma2 family endonuclease
MNAMTQPKLSLQAYLAWESEQPDRHEFHRGEVFAMTGARRVHLCVVGNLMRHLGNQLAETPCRAFSESAKLQIGEDTVLYPDVMVTCDRADLATDMIFRSPTAVIEVLSPSTQAYDRSHKFALYRRIPALREYVLVDADTRRVESFRRNAQDQWVLFDMSDGEALDIAAIDARVTLADLFDGVDPPPADTASAA